MSSVSKPRVRHNRHKQGLNLTLEKLSADFRYFTFKGLAGEESGLMGSKPHYHYLSDKSGIVWDDLVKRIKDCDMPSSNNHIVITR